MAGVPGRTMFVDPNNDGAWQTATEPSGATDAAGRYAIPVAFQAGVAFTVRHVGQAGWRQTLPASPGRTVTFRAPGHPS
jgi:hypothetical protein